MSSGTCTVVLAVLLFGTAVLSGVSGDGEFGTPDAPKWTWKTCINTYYDSVTDKCKYLDILKKCVENIVTVTDAETGRFGNFLTNFINKKKKKCPVINYRS